MVAKSKDDRYRSAADLIGELSNWRAVAPSSSAKGSSASIPQNVISAIFDDE
jgi:hypothetical protein